MLTQANNGRIARSAAELAALVAGVLVLYLLLGRRALHQIDGHFLLWDHNLGTRSHRYLTFFHGSLAWCRQTFEPLGLTLFECARLLSALGTAAAIVPLYGAARLLDVPHRTAMAVSLVWATLPTQLFFATIVEVHGPSMPFLATGLVGIALYARAPRRTWPAVALLWCGFAVAAADAMARPSGTGLIQHPVTPLLALALTATAGLRSASATMCWIAVAAAGIWLAFLAHPTGSLMLFLIPAAVAAKQRRAFGKKASDIVAWGTTGFLFIVTIAPGRLLGRDSSNPLEDSSVTLEYLWHDLGSLGDPTRFALVLGREFIVPLGASALVLAAARPRVNLRITASLAAACVPYFIACWLLLDPGEREYGAYLQPLMFVLVVAGVGVLREATRHRLTLAAVTAAAGLATYAVLVRVDPGKRGNAAVARELTNEHAGAQWLIICQADLETRLLFEPDVEPAEFALYLRLQPEQVRAAAKIYRQHVATRLEGVVLTEEARRYLLDASTTNAAASAILESLAIGPPPPGKQVIRLGE